MLDFDALVSTVWPEFAVNGKQNITIRELLPIAPACLALDQDLTQHDVAVWTPVIRAIEAQHPLWEPGTTFAYYALTYGWLAGEAGDLTYGLRSRAARASPSM